MIRSHPTYSTRSRLDRKESRGSKDTKSMIKSTIRSVAKDAISESATAGGEEVVVVCSGGDGGGGGGGGAGSEPKCHGTYKKDMRDLAFFLFVDLVQGQYYVLTGLYQLWQL
ncbi:hypothetical protein HZH66_008634 [Vespula vulgaris]|uniref:Uncharacterized protein n=1 Tax=Vespula vulgaris TaxID=7454 RepID=A0A834JSK7_VESVU|nr:hypothetical protein HZH66_008634 [Vespula vulgaris]